MAENQAPVPVAEEDSRKIAQFEGTVAVEKEQNNATSKEVTQAQKRPRYNDTAFGDLSRKIAEEKEQNKAATSKDVTQAQKRPRYNDKAFGDLSVNELENVVRDAISFKRQCFAKDEELAQFKDVKSEKTALVKQVKALQAELASNQKDADKLKGAVKGQDDDYFSHADRIKKALEKTLTSQMVYQAALKEQLQTEGRDIVSFIANVSPAVLKELGIEQGSQTKYSHMLFGQQVTKASPAGKLVMKRDLSVKYVKSTCELRVEATYTLGDVKSSGNKKKSSAKDAGKDAVVDDAAQDEQDQEQAGEDIPLEAASELPVTSEA